MDELLRQCLEGEVGRLQVCHVISEIVGVARADRIADAVRKEGGDELTTAWLFPCDRDVMVAKRHIGQDGLVDAPAAGGMYLSSFSKWIKQEDYDNEVTGRVLYILDVGLGQITADMELTVAMLLDGFNRSAARKGESWSPIIWTVSGGNTLLTTDCTLKRALTMEAPTVQAFILACPVERDDPIRHKGNKNWTKTVGELIMDHIEAKGGAATFVVVSAYKEAWDIHNHEPLRDLEFQSIGPWSRIGRVVEAAKAPKKNTILHVNRDIGLLPDMVNIAMVFVAPCLVDYTFDEDSASIVEANIEMPHQQQLAHIVVGGNVNVPVHIFELPDDDPARKMHPTVMDRGYIKCAEACLFGHLSPEAQPLVRWRILETSVGRHRFEEAGLLLVNDRLNFVNFPSFLGVETSPPAIILLESVIKMIRSGAEAGHEYYIRVEMAALVAQGLSSILQPSSTPEKVEAAMKKLASQGIAAAREAYRGQLWILLALVHDYRQTRETDLARPEVMDCVLRRIDMFTKILDLPPQESATKRDEELSQVAMLGLENTLVVAFSDNLLATPDPKPAGLEMLHTLSNIVIKATDKTVDWARFEELHPEQFEAGGPDMVEPRKREWVTFSRLSEATNCRFSVCPTLYMNMSDGNKTYLPLNSTGVSRLGAARAERGDTFELRSWRLASGK